MDRNSLIGTVLIALVTVFFLINTNQKRQEDALEQQRVEEIRMADSIAAARRNGNVGPTGKQDPVAISSDETVIESIDTEKYSSAQLDSIKVNAEAQLDESRKGKYGVFYAQSTGENKITVAENEVFKIGFSNKGGTIDYVELKNFNTYTGEPLILLDSSRFKSNFRIAIPGLKSVNSADLYFEPEGKGFTVSGKEKSSISFRLKVSDDKYFEQKYTLSGNSYLIDYQVNLVGLNDVIPVNESYIYHTVSATMAPLEQNLETERRYSNLYYRSKNSDVENLSQGKTNEVSFDTDVEWVSFKQQFFNSTIIYKDGFKNGMLKLEIDAEDSTYVKKYEADLRLPYRSNKLVSYNLQYFFGPNKYRTLKKMKNEMENIIQLAPDFFLFKWFGYISKWLIIPIFSFLEKHIASYGIIILIMTIAIKMALFPLTFKSYKSAAAMRVLKPDLDALKEKFKDDQQKLGTEQMKLYSSAGVNPLGGCLPMLVQMPILLAMYYFFPSSIELRQESFLWAQDLSTYDNIFNLPFTIPIYGSHVSLFTLLMTVSSILYATTQPQMSAGGPGGAQMKFMPYIFPFFLLFIFNSWPAALTYYYFLSNIITFGQSWAAKKFFIDEEKLYQAMQENKKKPKKASKWQKRLEDIQRQQKQKAKNQGRNSLKKKK